MTSACVLLVVQGIQVAYTASTQMPTLPDCTPPVLSLFVDCSDQPTVEQHTETAGIITRMGGYESCTYVQYDIQTGGNLSLTFDQVLLNYYWSSFLYVYVCENDGVTCPKMATITGANLPHCTFFSSSGRIKVEFLALSSDVDPLYGAVWGNYSFSWTTLRNETVAVNATQGGDSDHSICVLNRFLFNVTNSSGTIEHVFSAAKGYPSDSNYTWDIIPDTPMRSVTLEFLAFETEQDFDYMYVYGCESIYGKCELVRTLSGLEQPCNVTINAPVARITFISDPYFGLRGFYIRYATSGEASNDPTLCTHDLLCPEGGDAGLAIAPPRLRWEDVCCKNEQKNFKYTGNFWGTYVLEPGNEETFVVYTVGAAEGKLDCSDSEAELNSLYHNTTYTEVFDEGNYLPGALWQVNQASATTKYNTRFGMAQKVWVNGTVRTYGPLPAPELNGNGSSAKLHITAASCMPIWHPFGTKWITSNRILTKMVQFVSPPSIIVTMTIPYVPPSYYNVSASQAQLTSTVEADEKDSLRPAVIVNKALLNTLTLENSPWRVHIKSLSITVSVAYISQVFLTHACVLRHIPCVKKCIK
jgi:hypothetical protein